MEDQTDRQDEAQGSTSKYMISLEKAQDIDWMFRYQPLKDDQAHRYVAVREAARRLAITIMGNTPSCADQTTAIRKVREAVMTANAAIAINE